MALKLFAGCFIALFCCFYVVFIVGAPSGVLAHQLSVFAWVEGDNVKVQGKFTKGKHPKQGTIFVYDENDKLLFQILKKHRARWMVWEGQPIRAAIEKLNEMGISSVVFNPCGNMPKDGDFMSIMQQNVSNLGAVFR
jgi:hypothetical protein